MSHDQNLRLRQLGPRTYPLIAVEGVDAAGKATATAAIVTWLLEAGYDASSFSFPAYDSPTGRLLGQHLRGEWSVQPSATRLDAAMLRVGDGEPQEYADIVEEQRCADMMVRQALMTANRLEAQPAIEAALRRGPVVLDRWWASSLAYGRAEGLDTDWIHAISRTLLRPDLWIVLDGDPEALARRRVARDLNERDPDKLRRVREAYQLLAFEQSTGGRWVQVDAEQPTAAVAQQCCSAIGRFLPDRPGSPASRISPG